MPLGDLFILLNPVAEISASRSKLQGSHIPLGFYTVLRS